MNTNTPKKVLVPLTIQQLRALKSGQTIVYYKGHFATDIARCTPTQSSGDTGAPLYERVLIALSEEASKLESEGKLTLSQKTIRMDEGRMNYIEYSATGR